MDWTTEPWWWGVVAALVAFVTGGGALRLVQAIRSAQLESRTRRLPDVTAAVLDIYSTLHTLQRATGAGRVLVLRASNGGNRPHPAKPLYISILYETTGGLTLVRDDWDKRQVDEEYIGLLARLLDEEIVQLTTAEMAPGLLRDVYTSDGVIGSKVALVSVAEEHMIYLSVVYDRPRPMDPDSSARRRAAIRVAIAKIRRLMDSVAV